MRKFIFSLLLSISFVGLINALTLYSEYQQYVQTSQPIMCFVGNACETVLSSKYGATFGIKNEIYGIGYYLLTMLGLLIGYFNREWQNKVIIGLKIISIGSVLFSIYLLSIQIFVLHEFCFRCLIAITINLLIFLLTMFGLNSQQKNSAGEISITTNN
jgi:uncharacterized membrane protein